MAKTTRVVDAPNFIPEGNRLLLKRLSSASVTEGGIHLPDTAQKKSQKCVVMNRGPGTYLNGERDCEIPESLLVGDIVVISQYSGNEITLEGQDYVIVDMREILGTIPAPTK